MQVPRRSGVVRVTNMIRWFLAVAVLSVLANALVFAQNSNATIVGTVLDATGANIPEAKITVRNVQTNDSRGLVCDATGEFTIVNLQPGIYEIAVEKQGFQRLVETGLQLLVGQTARLNLKLKVGSVSEVVEVQGQAPLLNTENSAKGDVISTEEINNMPLNGRNFGDLAFLVPGVLPQVQGSDEGSGYSINGARTDNTNFVVDGFNNQKQRDGQQQVSPPLDSMQEFKVQTTGYSAEYGRLAGGVISMALKTGGNQLHGTLSEYIRNDAFDARNFFALSKPKLRRNQFGASLNGPVVIPKLYNGRNRTFFLVSWESVRTRSGSIAYAVIPTQIQQQGDFSQTVDSKGKLVNLIDPLAGNAQFPGNKIPASRLDPIALKVAKYYPAPNFSGLGTNNYYAYGPSSSSPDNFLFKVDHRITDKDTVSFRLIPARTSSMNPFDGSKVPGFGGYSLNNTYLYGLTYTRSFTPVLLNEARLGFTRSKPRLTGLYDGQNISEQLGLPLASTDSRSLGFPRFEPSDIEGIGDGKNVPTQAYSNVWQFADTVTWAKSRHLLKAGFDVIRSQFFEPYNLRVRGSYAFKGKWTNVGYADQLLGYVDTTQRQLGGAATNYLFSTTMGAFVQEDWKARSNLTINFGLRYELMTPPYEKYGRLGNFVPSVGKQIIGSDVMVPNIAELLAKAGLSGSVGLAKDYGLSESLAQTNHKNFAPRVGIAWRPFGGTNTVIRTGYGIYYGNSATKSVRSDLGNIYPFVYPQNFVRNSKNALALTLQNPFPTDLAGIVGSTNTAGYQTDAPSQYLQSWNFTVERQIGNSAIELGYIGSKGTHLGRRYDLNQPLRKPEYKLTNGSFPKPFPAWSTIQYYGFGSNSNYHSASVTVRRRFARDFFFRVNYVFSKALDEASQLAGYSNNGYGGAQDSRNIRLEHGRADFDRRQAFTLGLMYETKFRNVLLKSWQIAATGIMYSGVGMTPYTNSASLDLGEAARPDRTALGTLANPTPQMWFDINAFPIVPAGAYRNGTSGRNIIDGPGNITQNISLMKKFYVRERAYIQFRWEAFNFINHANFRLPELGIGRVNVGTITAAEAARSMQFALRFAF